MHTRPCVCPLRVGVSVFPRPVEFLWSNPVGFQSQIFWGSAAIAGDPDMGLRTFTPVGEFLWPNSFPVCGSPTWWWLWFDFIMIAPFLLSCCGFFFIFGCRISIFVGFYFVVISWWLFSSYSWFWCFCKKRWVHVLLLLSFSLCLKQQCLERDLFSMQ